VHGVSSSARSVWPIAQAFKAYGYKEEELYGTTYGVSMGGMPMQTALDCEYIKGVGFLLFKLCVHEQDWYEISLKMISNTLRSGT
jgi:hypothetical protein